MGFISGGYRGLVFALLVGISGCWMGSPSPAEKVALRPAPSLDELKNTTYNGVEQAEGPFTLSSGRWEGKPYAGGGASVPSVTLLGNIRLAADLDGDGSEESVVLLAASAGGTGEILYLATVRRAAGALVNTATAPIGDRVQLRAARIEGRSVVLDLVQAGPNDPMCCPGDLVTRSWVLEDGVLREGSPLSGGRLSPAALHGTEWVLRSWNWNEAAPTQPEVTFKVDEGRIAGRAGCNTYFAPVKGGDLPGDLSFGPIGLTRMLCPPATMAIESRFLQQLGNVHRLRFVAGQLALPFEHGEQNGVMLFERRATPP